MFTTTLLEALPTLLPFQQDQFQAFLQELAQGLGNPEELAHSVAEEVSLTVFANMSVRELLQGATLASVQNIQHDIDYDQLATRLLLLQNYQDSLRATTGPKDLDQLYQDSFRNYIDLGITAELLDPQMGKVFDLNKVAAALRPERDLMFNYIGLSTTLNRYCIHDREQVLLETPQFQWMRIAMGISLKEDHPTERALQFYDKLSKLEYIPGGSTNIGAGTTFPVLSNCYLLDTEDDIHSIFDNVKNVAIISKATGGIGLSVTKLRAAGSPIKSNNTFSTGPIPFVKVMDSALRSMSRGGKKYGALCVYMEPWHLNIFEFIDLKQNAGDDYQRARTADIAVYIPDEFMKRVINGSDWYMFDPAETPELTELYGAEFSKKYAEYVEKAKSGQIRMHKVIPAREMMHKMLMSLQGTSHPWFTWKDTINLRALNNNTGTIHCSNLCTEICLPQDRENIAVCNLAYINLAKHIKWVGGRAQVDYDKLESTVRVLMRHLDNLIDVNASPLKETKNSDDNNRAVGMGMSGFAEVLEYFGFAYDSPESYELIDEVTEFISYTSIDESCNMAQERGAYANFPGSMWSKGCVPFDTIAKVAQDRTGKAEQGDELTEIERQIVQLETAMGKDQPGNAAIAGVLSQLQKHVSKLRSQTTSTEGGVFPNEPGKGIELRQNRTSRMDWDRLRDRVRQGIRNATTMAIAPNASTGLVLGTSPGLDPRFANVFSRNTSNGKFLDINQNLVKALKARGIWNETKDQVLAAYGDISEIPEIPDDLKAIYKTSFQVSPYAYIEVASRAQKWIDQAISRNMYLETRDIDEMIEIYTEAWRRGVKTTYYLHTKPRHTAEQSTLKVNKAAEIGKRGFGSTGAEEGEAKVEIVQAEVQVAAIIPQETVVMESPAPKHGFGQVAASITSPEPQAVATSPIDIGVMVQEIVVTPVVEPEVQTVTATQVLQPLNAAAQTAVAQSQGSNRGFGFAKAGALQPARQVGPQKAFHHAPAAEVKPMKKTIAIGQECPLDPAERALCEACQ